MKLSEQIRAFEDSLCNRRNSVKPATIVTYRSIISAWLLPNFGDMDLSEITNGVVRNFVAHLVQNKLSAASIQMILRVLKGVIASAVNSEGELLYPKVWNHRFIDAPLIDPTKQKRATLTSEQLSESIKSAGQPFRDLFVVLGGTGMRIGEALAVKTVNDNKSSFYCPEESKIVLRTADWRGIEQEPKTRAGVREIDLCSELNGYLKGVEGSRGYLLPKTNRRSWYMGADRYGINGFHAFRRFRVTKLRQSGVPEDLLKFWIGHHKESVTDLYDQTDKDRAFRKEWAEKVRLGFQL